MQISDGVSILRVNSMKVLWENSPREHHPTVEILAAREDISTAVGAPVSVMPCMCRLLWHR